MDNQDEEMRGTGRTTGRILEVMARASQDPSIWHEFQDHYPMSDRRKRSFAKLIPSKGKAMGLRYAARVHFGRVEVMYPVHKIKQKKKLINYELMSNKVTEITGLPASLDAANDVLFDGSILRFDFFDMPINVAEDHYKEMTPTDCEIVVDGETLLIGVRPIEVNCSYLKRLSSIWFAVGSHSSEVTQTA